jgi:ankyrin repeat protein
MRLDLATASHRTDQLLAGVASAEPRALDAVRWNHPRFRLFDAERLRHEPFSRADAELVVARQQHFESWEALLEFFNAVATGDPAVLSFENAADATVAGDSAALQRLIESVPALPIARSTRMHRSTLLHYVSANGVENDRQITPDNIVAIAQQLLVAGADVNATSEAYGGNSTVLGLVSTSAHPRAQGVQIPLIDLLLAHGARIDGPDDLPMLVRNAIANGCPEAAVALAARGTAVPTLYAAAGAGQLDRVQSRFAAATVAQREAALMVAAQQGHEPCVRWLLDQGVNVAANDGMTALHNAAGHGHLAVVELLLARGAPLEAVNSYGGTVLSSTLWFAGAVLPSHAATRDFPRMLASLLHAGARTDMYPEMAQDIADAMKRDIAIM